MRELKRLDFALLVLLRTVGHSRRADRWMSRFSHLGEHGLLWIGIGLLGGAVDPEQGDRWRRGAAGVAVAYGVNTAIKVVVRRRRPRLLGLRKLTSTPTKLSFPSAHAATGFAGARAYSALAPGAPFYGLAGSLALSRLYLGVHWPSDSVAGALLGTAIGTAAR